MSQLPVYEAEIIDEEEEDAKIVPLDAGPPVKSLAYKLGKAAGSIVGALAFLYEARGILKTGRTSGGNMCSGMGKGKGRRKRRMRSMI